MNQRAKKIVKFVLRWGIAVCGIWWVIAHMSLRDSVLLLNPTTDTVQRVPLAEHDTEDSVAFKVVDPITGKPIDVPPDRIVNPASLDDKPKPITISIDGKPTPSQLLGMRLLGDINRNPTVSQLLVKEPSSNTGHWIFPSEVVGGFKLDVPRPRIEVGIISMVEHAKLWLLILSVIVFPITFMITAYRWHELLKVIDVQMTLWRAFVITMVGSFYNTFMPGSVGGDVFKMYYASKQTPHKARAVFSVLIDRILGLLALVMIGGVMATYQYFVAPDKSDPSARSCLHVALGCVAIMGGVGVGLAVLFQPTFRRLLGMEWILSKLPMQHHVAHIRDVMRIYRRKPVLMLAMLFVTIPVHVTVIVSAILSGKAFGLPIQPIYYFTAVPVIVLVGSIPISPQGAGVMEFFAIMLTQKQGATVSQAFALCMCIRVVQIFWNLTGGIFVLRGGFHVPTESEQREMEEDDHEPAAP